MRTALTTAVLFAIGVAIGSIIMGWESSDLRTVLVAFSACAYGHWAGQHHRERPHARAR